MNSQRKFEAFGAFLLGGVVPLIALGVTLERSGLTHIDNGSATGSAVVLGLFGSIALLSLSSFFLLRRGINESLAKSHELAYYDSLTGLPNRRLYQERLERAIRHANASSDFLAVCFLDLDGFKRVNDSLGHASGDRLLCAVAERLVDSVRLGDCIARGDQLDLQFAVSRLGGDEFTFLLNGISQPSDAGLVAERVMEVLRTPFQLEGHEVFATGSLGIAVYPADGEDADTLVKNADTAMYHAKGRGRNNYQFFSTAMNESATRKLDIERQLRRAIEQNRFELHYQPVRQAISGEVVGAEALLRLSDAKKRLISPSEFIPVAEEVGLISVIGEWVLRAACRQARAWQEAGFEPIRVAVNVSGRQLRSEGFVGDVKQILDAHGLSPHLLELEITESTIMQNDDVTNAAFEGLRALGIGLALDDFGTGYSSLSYLRRLPISRLKIDRSFIADVATSPVEECLTSAIIGMAHGLALKVVAEGVESLEQAELLQRLKCDELQGHLLSPAVPAEVFIRFLERKRQD